MGGRVRRINGVGILGTCAAEQVNRFVTPCFHFPLSAEPLSQELPCAKGLVDAEGQAGANTALGLFISHLPLFASFCLTWSGV